MYHTLSRPHLYSVLRILPQFVDEYNSTKDGGRATAFFVGLRDGRLFVVTNRHAVDPGYQKREKKGWRLIEIRLFGFSEAQHKPFEAQLSDVAPHFPDDDAIDLAAIDITGVQYEGDLDGRVIPIKQPYIADDAYFDTLEPLDEVAFPYLHGEKRMPIFRIGRIASDPSVDFKLDEFPDTPRLMFEARSIASYSGAPVFALGRGLKAGDGVTWSGVNREERLIGVNAGHLNDHDKLNLGLSHAIKSTALLDLLAKCP